MSSTMVAPNRQFESLAISSHGSNYRLGGLRKDARKQNARYRRLIASQKAGLRKAEKAGNVIDEELLQRGLEETEQAYKSWYASNLAPRSISSSKRVLVKERRDLASKAVSGDNLASLQLNVQNAGLAFMDSLKRSGITRPDSSGQRKNRQELIMNNRSRWYGQMMVMQMMRPMRNGFSAGSVLQVAGMSAMLFAISPDFRQQVGSKFSSISKAVKDRVRSKQVDRARSKLEKAELSGKTPKAKWRERVERMEFETRGNRPIYVPRTAAMVQVSLMESAYQEMRDPGIPASRREEHYQLVKESYDSAMDVLNAYIKDDGLDRSDVDDEMRLIVGDRMQNEPGLAAVFRELGHGQFERSTAVVKGRLDGRDVTLWDKSFVDTISGGVVTKGSFSLRMPAKPGEHVVRCSEVLAGEINQAKDLDDLNAIFESYTAASLARRLPHLESGEAIVDARIAKARRMFTSMDEDGLSMLDKRYVYNEALVSAMEAVGKDRPELLQAWTAQYGTEWKADIKNVVDTFSEIGRSAERKEIIEFLRSRNYSVEQAEQIADVHIEMTDTEEYLMAHPKTSKEVLGATMVEEFDADEAGIVTADEPEPIETYHTLEFPTKADPGTSKDKVMQIMGVLADKIQDDVEDSCDRQGQYIEGTYVLPMGADEPNIQYRGPEEFVTASMDDWRNMAALAQNGGQYIDNGFGNLTGPELATARRAAWAASASRALDDLGVPAITRDQMLGAATVMGIEQAMVNEVAMSYIDESLEDYGGSSMQATSEGWRQQIYSDVVLNTPSGKKDPKASLRHGYGLWAGIFDKFKDTTAQGKIDDLKLEKTRDGVLKPLRSLVRGADEKVAAKIGNHSKQVGATAVKEAQEQPVLVNDMDQELVK